MNANSKNSAPTEWDSHADAAKSKLPPLKALLAFEAASRCGSFSQGAEELSVTPSAISHHIQRLEDFLGVLLFQRHAGRAVLTTAGRRLCWGDRTRIRSDCQRDPPRGAAVSKRPSRHSTSGARTSPPSGFQPRISDFLVANPAVKIAACRP